MSLSHLYDGFVFDLDGTVYLGDALTKGAAAAVTELRRAGRRLAYLTNKPLELSSAYAEKLTRLGLPTRPEEVVSSLDTLVSYLDGKHPGAPLLCVAESLVAETVAAAGFPVVPTDEAEQADVVVVSFDRTFDYEKLHAAYRAVRAGAAIVATNPDPYCPTPEGGLPDCAAMLAAVEACTGAKAEAVVGKPSPHMARAVLDRIGLAPGRVLLVGDRLSTDVAMAREAGMDAALVLTGVTTREEAMAAHPGPDYVLEDLADLLTLDPQPEATGR